MWWTPCTCERPPWSISAPEVEGVIGEHLTVKKGVFRVCDVGVFPIPWFRIPLNPRAPRLLFPEFRIGDEGSVVGQPVWLPLGQEGEIVLTPEIWTNRGVRQRVEVSGPLGEGRMAVAREGLYGLNRTQLDVNGGSDKDGLRLAMDVGWASDTGVRQDYGASFFQRSKPFEEQLMVAGLGFFRLESNTHDQSEVDKPLAAVLALEGLSLGGASLGGYARVDGVRRGEDAVQRSASGIHLTTGHAFSSLDTEARIEIDAVQMSDSMPYSHAGFRGAAMLPTWSDWGQARLVGQTGVEVSSDLDRGQIDDPLGWIQPQPLWGIGPIHRTTVVTRSGVPFQFEGAVLRTPQGWEPSVEARINHKGYTGALAADRLVQGGFLGFSDEAADVRLGAVRGAEILQGMLGGSFLAFREWRPGWSGHYDFYSGKLLRQGPSLQWDSGCDCLSVTVSVEWAQDRELPTGMLRLDLHPR